MREPRIHGTRAESASARVGKYAPDQLVLAGMPRDPELKRVAVGLVASVLEADEVVLLGL